MTRTHDQFVAQAVHDPGSAWGRSAVAPVLAGADIACTSWPVRSYRAGSTLEGVPGRLLYG